LPLVGQLKPAIRDGLRWMDFAMRPYAVLPGYDLTRLKKDAIANDVDAALQRPVGLDKLTKPS
jgi:hypothetical protein